MSEGSPTARRRDAAATRQALLDAARELFDAHGFRGTTVRAIGERAGVDQALIARYFGGKAELYQAVLDQDRLSVEPTPSASATAAAAAAEPPAERRSPRHVIDAMLRRVDEHGVGPVLRALSDPDTDAATRDELGGRLRAYVTAPLETWLREAGVVDPGLRAEVVVAALLGVMITRATGGLPRVAAADREALAAVLEELLG
ncbi:MAG TPA: helix-turn-helix domain-containing protein [Baekduia sp.]|uniref:TetR/AcrR family transcriptional regulator n=1 Tax=Baekduia sp. TaxID=2600305 RepID=UPI002D76588D|nr:helix-turn-helix domain-containing protein [Baekduia sp.]HET6509591.1 helix-turn-helix domain-containing protein [Baekduia sp.]